MKLSIIILILFLSCSEKGELVETEIIRPVRSFVVGFGTSANNRTFSGVSKAGLESRLSFRVSGVVNNILVKSGDRVRKNQILATIDDSDAKIAFQQAQASEKNAKAQQETARSNLARLKTLYENRSTSLNNYEQAKNSFASATSNYKTAKSTLDLKLKDLSYYQLKSPFGGVVGTVSIEKNETIQAGNPIIELNSGGDIEIRVGIPESFIKNIQKENLADVRFATIANKVFEATVNEVSFNIDNQSSTFPVVVKLNHPTSDIRPGMSATVSFNVANTSSSSQLIIPAAVVSNDQQGNFVYLLKTLDSNTVVKKTYVELGQLLNDGFEVLSGLTEGNKIVNAGIEQMRDGLIVKSIN